MGGRSRSPYPSEYRLSWCGWFVRRAGRHRTLPETPGLSRRTTSAAPSCGSGDTGGQASVLLRNSSFTGILTLWMW